jgi:hypothetical protein
VGESRRTESERLVISALMSQLRDGEFLLHNIRFSDSQHGDVECDVLVFCPGLGIAAIEIKGGVVSFNDGEWVVNTGNGTRRINPVEQARKSKHALRRFLDRQNEWNLGLVRSEWLVAMPFTQVDSDMGTEGRRDLLIDSRDLSSAMERVRNALDSAFHSEPRPTSDDLELAKNLILSSGSAVEVGKADSTSSSRHALAFAGIGVAVAVASAFLSHSVTNGNHLLTAGITAPLGALASLYVAKRPAKRSLRLAAGLTAALLGTGLGAAFASAADADDAAGCNPNYSPCIPIVKDLDCKQIIGQVHVIGKDVYNLDRDGDGLGCEWNEPSPSASA